MANDVGKGKTDSSNSPKKEIILDEVVPTLFVALGGTGAQVLWRIRRRIMNTLWGNGGETVRLENITDFPFAEFLQVDLSSYETEQGKAVKGDMLSSKIQFRENEQLIKKLPLEKYTKTEEELNIYPLIQEWFPLSRKTINELNIDVEKGAGQIRAISRLYFFDQYEALKSLIRTKADSLLANVTTDKAQKRLGLKLKTGALKIVVIASTAGGTGSGGFLDVGYLVDWIGRAVSTQGVTTNLVLLLPSGYTGANLVRTQANTYAAMMEMEACMRQGSRYIKQWKKLEVPKLSEAPYGDVYLIDTANLAGEKTAEITDIYEMVADALFEDFSTAEFANRKRSIAVNQNLHKVVPYEMGLPTGQYGDTSITFSRAYSSFGQAIIDTQLEQKQNVILFRQVNAMLKAFFGVASDDPKSNMPTEGERDELLESRMHLGSDNVKIDYDFVVNHDQYYKGAEHDSYHLVTELLRVNDIITLDDIETRIDAVFEEIRTSGSHKEWSERIAEVLKGINRDTFKGVESGSGIHDDAISRRRRELLAELTDPQRKAGIVKALWSRVDNKERGGLDYTIDLIHRIKDQLDNPETGIVKRLEESTQWFADLSGFLRKTDTATLQEHLLQAIDKWIGGKGLAEAKIKQIAQSVKLYVHYHLYAIASREAALLAAAFSDFLGRKQGTDEDGNPIWDGFIGDLERGRGLVRDIILASEEQITRTQEAMKQSHAMYFVLPAPKSRIDELELLSKAEARRWAEEVFQDFGGTQQLFSLLQQDEGRAELMGKLRNRALTLIEGDDAREKENPLFAALDTHPNLSHLFGDFMRRSMPWVFAHLEKYLKDQTPEDQYKCVIGVKDAATFKARYGARLMQSLPATTLMTETQVGFVEIDTPGKMVCYTELSGLPLPSLRNLDQWFVSYKSEDKIPVHCHKNTGTFVHARELTLDELASRAEDFKLYIQAIALGVLRRNKTNGYSVTEKGRIQDAGGERKFRLSGLSDQYREIIERQVRQDLELLVTPDQLAVWGALLEYYAASVYPEARIHKDEEDVFRKGLPTLMCEQLKTDAIQRLERKVGQGTAERLLRLASEQIRDLTDEIPGSKEEVYTYEVNNEDQENKRVLRKEIFHPTYQLEKIIQPPIVNLTNKWNNSGGTVAPPPIGLHMHPEGFMPFKVAIDGKSCGPFDWPQLVELADKGQLLITSKVWQRGMGDWQPAGQINILESLFAVEEPPLFDDEEPPLN